jgi:hypothetical protein
MCTEPKFVNVLGSHGLIPRPIPGLLKRLQIRALDCCTEHAHWTQNGEKREQFKGGGGLVCVDRQRNILKAVHTFCCRLLLLIPSHLSRHLLRQAVPATQREED